MFSWDSRRTRRSGRDRRRPDITAMIEALEGRELMAYSTLGWNLPDLTVSGYGPPVAAWGQPVAFTVNVSNIGSGTMIEPLALAPTDIGASVAPASTVAVYASRSPNARSGVLIGQIDVPSLNGNETTTVTQTLVMPTRPANFPGDGGRVYFWFRANSTGTVYESDYTNDRSPTCSATIQAPLPELSAVGLDVPPVMQPGDTIQPNIRVANFGPADTNLQAPVQVALVASTTPSFTSGSSIVALYTIDNIPSQALVPSKRPVYADANLDPTTNIVTIIGEPVTLPLEPAEYYLGVVVDPYNQIQELRKVPQFATKYSNGFSLVQNVGPRLNGLLPAGVEFAGGASNVPLFPYPVGGNAVGQLPGGAGLPVFPYAPLTTTTAITATSATTIGTTAATTASLPTFGGATAAQNRAAVLARFRNQNVHRFSMAGADRAALARAVASLKSQPTTASTPAGDATTGGTTS